MLISHDTPVSAGGVCIIRLYNPVSFREIKMLRGHEHIVNCLLETENLLISGSKEPWILFWSKRNNFTLLRKVPGPPNLISMTKSPFVNVFILGKRMWGAIQMMHLKLKQPLQIHRETATILHAIPGTNRLFRTNLFRGKCSYEKWTSPFSKIDLVAGIEVSQF